MLPRFVSPTALFVISVALLPSDVQSLCLGRDSAFFKVIRLIDHQDFLARVACQPEMLNDPALSFVVVLPVDRLPRSTVPSPPAEMSSPDMVAPSSILSPDPVDLKDRSSLRQAASVAGLCYLRRVYSFDASATLVRVAALPHRLHQGAMSYSAVLSDGQLALALPWSRRLQALPYHEARELVEAHARRTDPGFVGWSGAAPTPAPRRTGGAAARAVSRELWRQVVDAEKIDVHVSSDVLPRAFNPGSALPRLGETPPPTPAGAQSKWFQVALLRAALLALKHEMEQETQPQLLDLLKRKDQVIRKVLVFQNLFGGYCPQLVDVAPVFQDDRLVGCDLRVACVA